MVYWAKPNVVETAPPSVCKPVTAARNRFGPDVSMAGYPAAAVREKSVTLSPVLVNSAIVPLPLHGPDAEDRK